MRNVQRVHARHFRNRRDAQGSRKNAEEQSHHAELTTSKKPPLSPAHFYEDASKVEHYLEKRRGVEFYPEGSKPGVDLSNAALKELAEEFEEEPDVFKHCILVRDFAEPLRTGSGLNAVHPRTSLKISKNRTGEHPASPEGLLHEAAKPLLHGNVTLTKNKPNSFVQLPQNLLDLNDDDDDGDENSDSNSDLEIDPALIHPKGGVSDKDGGDKDAQLEVNMFAYMKSVSGEVAVIANGHIAKWSSKKKVPIAGFMCSHEEGLTLHTLPTPCVETILDEDGKVQPPPSLKRMMSKRGRSTFASPAPAPGFGLIAEEGEAEDDGEAAFLTMNRSVYRKRKHVHATYSGPIPAPSPAASPARAPSDEWDSGKNYNVYVGDTLLKFSSKKKAHDFCEKLSYWIADDMGDTEWTTEYLKSKELETDMHIGEFVQMVRQKPQKDWTTGKKTILVVIMDWKKGDDTKAPFSKQTLAPDYYKNTIMPKVKHIFKKMSFGTYDLDYTVVPKVIRFQRDRVYYAAKGYPFPGLYEGAEASLMGDATFGNRYHFANYDLVYVLTPQQTPAGTKGVAWVGAKGAMCNGCEGISESFQVMVAVHELGHNLGLAHASSGSLEYGNPFDWMGNYPDVTGLTFGLSYKLKLHWIPTHSVKKITNKDVFDLNDKIILKPFDGDKWPTQGEIVGVQVSLKENNRDLFIAYRKTAGQEAGVYLTKEDREKPNSELIDMGCHTASQKDARLRPGWTYVDSSDQVVVIVHSVNPQAAIIQVYKAPGEAGLAAIRERPKYSDGAYKCPRTCTDSDLLLTKFPSGCKGLASKGYCRAALKMSGKTLKIKVDLCPKACNNCEAVLRGSPLVGGSHGGVACEDKKIRIGGKTCPGVAHAGFCEYTTNIGHVGEDLCPKSCNMCPSVPSFSAAAGSGAPFADPKPKRTVGHGNGVAFTQQLEDSFSVDMAEADKSEDQDFVVKVLDVDVTDDNAGTGATETQDGASNIEDNSADADYSESTEQGEQEAEPEPESECVDDPNWQDKDGDGCAVYGLYIADGKIGREQACSYNDGEAREKCKLTCAVCTGGEMSPQGKCEDRECIDKWKLLTGQCYKCSDWPSRCDEPHVAADCPLTCNICTAPATSTMPVATLPPSKTACEDKDCIDGWLDKYGKCYKCKEFASDYCSADVAVLRSCPKSCRVCTDDTSAKACKDDWKRSTCRNYLDWSWCSHTEIKWHCRRTCDLCDASDLFVNPWDENGADDPYGYAAAPAPAKAGTSAPEEKGFAHESVHAWPMSVVALFLLSFIVHC